MGRPRRPWLRAGNADRAKPAAVPTMPAFALPLTEAANVDHPDLTALTSSTDLASVYAPPSRVDIDQLHPFLSDLG
jgi:hypothetical protein